MILSQNLPFAMSAKGEVILQRIVVIERIRSISQREKPWLILGMMIPMNRNEKPKVVSRTLHRRSRPLWSMALP